MAVEIEHERRHFERAGAAHALYRGDRDLCELHMAARTPRENLAGLRLRQLVERVGGKAPGGFGVTGAQLKDAAAMARAPHHAIVGAQRVHDIEAQERDVWGLEHVAAGIEYKIRRVVSCFFGRRVGWLCGLLSK